MKHNLLFTMALLFAASFPIVAEAEYYFSAESPSGHTLYYNYSTNGVQVSYPSNSIDAPYNDYDMPTGDLIIPTTVLHAGTVYTVNSINRYAFKGCTGLTSVTIPNTILGIGIDAFYGCTGLTTVEIPSSVTGIGVNAFYMVNNITYHETGTASGRPWGAKNINGYVSNGFVYTSSAKDTVSGYVSHDSTVAIPYGAKVIADNAFYGCTRMIATTIPTSVVAIGSWAYAFCDRLTEVAIPDSVRAIGERAFHYCKSLNKVTIGCRVDSLGDNAFCYCSALKQLTLPNSVAWIGKYAFYHCDSLKEIAFGTSLRDINFMAFAYCSVLDTINSLSWRPPTVDESAFSYTPTEKTIHVPCDRSTAYQNAWGRTYTYIEVGAAVGIDIANPTPERGSVKIWSDNGFSAGCDSMATIAAIANTGYYFSHWSDGDSTNPRTIRLTRDTIITVYFGATHTTGIATPQPTLGYTVSSHDGRITVAATDASPRSGQVRIVDTMGRTVATLRPTPTATTDRLPKGVYIVHTGSGIITKTAITQ